MSVLPRFVTTLAVATFASAVLAGDVHYDVPVRTLRISEGKLPTAGSRPNWRFAQRSAAMTPYAVLDGEGEVYVRFANGQFNSWTQLGQITDQASLAIRAPEGKPVSGRLYLPNSSLDGMVMVEFSVGDARATGPARKRFFEAKRAHYQQLLDRRTPGAAWFRHQIRLANTELGESDSATDTSRQGRRRPRPGSDDLTATYALFTGGRAVSENLALDRVLATTKHARPTVSLDSITGITVAEIDWSEKIDGLTPALDLLAAKIPADQHVVFFPSFDAVVKMRDEATRHGTPVLRLAEPRSEDARSLARYEQQMCLSLDAAARLLGPRVAKSVALTGSDPYFRTGTDVAVLFESPSPALLHGMLLARIKLAADGDPAAKLLDGKIGTVAYRGVRSPDRSLSSYVAALDKAVVVTNSLAQLKRLVRVEKGQADSIASLDEFTFFRDRYKLGEGEETAFLFLSDATIRRWCGPRWRIAASRRTREMALIAELQASQMETLVAGNVRSGPIHTDLPIGDLGRIKLRPDGVASSVHGSLAFMTPIAELKMDKVTKAEADGYRQWRDRYQRNWRWSFDPIGLRLSMRDDRLAADLTVMPLIWGTDYRELVSVSRGAAFAPRDGDPHDALAHVILAINTDSGMFQAAGNFISTMAKGVSLGWLGESVSLYADNDPFWREVAEIEDANERENFVEQRFNRLPIGAEIDVSSGFKLAVFLTGFRAFVEQAAPGMMQWESLEYNEQPYVKVTPTAKTREDLPEEMEDPALYYAPSSDSLVVTLNEGVLHRALDRRLARREAKSEEKPIEPAGQGWLGSNLALKVDRNILRLASDLSRDEYQAAMQIRSWGNLPILTQWKQLYPDSDPVDLHERIWRVRLVCPGGGEYVWNDTWHTMESTVYGHPGHPKRGPAAPPVLATFTSGDFGLTFEEQGLRARVSLEREKKP